MAEERVRRRLAAILIAAAGVPGLALAQSSDPGDNWTWKATGQAEIIDGDTIVLRGVTIRFAGLDAPELDQACMVDGVPYACGIAAKRHLEKLIDGREVRCFGWDDDWGLTPDGLQLATCHVWLAVNLSRTMIRDGWAIDQPATRGYSEEERTARQTRAGLWAGEFQPPWAWRRIKNEKQPNL